jgi:hypothetical protein
MHSRTIPLSRGVLCFEPVGERPGSPTGMLDSQLDDAGLDRRRHLMRARPRLARAVHQPDQALLTYFTSHGYIWRLTPLRRATSVTAAPS